VKFKNIIFEKRNYGRKTIAMFSNISVAGTAILALNKE
jgi:hypothetical protein